MLHKMFLALKQAFFYISIKHLIQITLSLLYQCQHISMYITVGVFK